MTIELFHGGVRGLEPGDIVLPPCETGAPSWSDVHYCTHRHDRVYFSPSLPTAAEYAMGYLWRVPGHRALLAGGDLYEVEPVGPIEVDPSPHVGGAFAAPAARVVRVIERNGLRPDESTLRDLDAEARDDPELRAWCGLEPVRSRVAA